MKMTFAKSSMFAINFSFFISFCLRVFDVFLTVILYIFTFPANITKKCNFRDAGIKANFLLQECDEVIHAIPDKARHHRIPLKNLPVKSAEFEQHLDATLQKIANINVPGSALSSASTSRAEDTPPDYSGLQDDYGYDEYYDDIPEWDPEDEDPASAEAPLAPPPPNAAARAGGSSPPRSARHALPRSL